MTTALRAGWYPLRPLADGEVARVVHGTGEAVVWAQDGHAHGLDAWCPHRGAHLGGGRVDADGLACPLHGWRWAPDGRNVAAGPDPAQPEAHCPTVPVHDGALGPLVWLSAASPATATHAAVDLAERVPAGAVPGGTSVLPLDGLDPALFLENGFDVAHVAHVHREAAPEVVATSFGDDLAELVLAHPPTGRRSTFVVYRGAQALVHLRTNRPDVALWVLGSVEVGTAPAFRLTYWGEGPGVERVLRRFVPRHLEESAHDLDLLRTVRPDRARWWGPRDGPLRAFRAWLDGLAP